MLDLYWDKLKTPPANALKKITAGRLKGKSDINPQWRYEVMTKVFGVCGVGWKFEIQDQWVSECSDKQVVQHMKILLYIKSGSEWSSPIPAVGGSMLVAKEKAGLYTNDEAAKMALTDALGVAMKMLGVAADVYRGMRETERYDNTQHFHYASSSKKKTYKNPDFLKLMGGYKKGMGEEGYYELLGKHGFEKANEIPPNKQASALKTFAERTQTAMEDRGE